MVRQIDNNLEDVRKAMAGDTESLAMLADQVRQRVYAYIRRATLREDVAADLTQDTVISVLSALRSLQQTERFWSWVLCIASNKIKQHYREESRHRRLALPQAAACEPSTGSLTSDVLTELAHNETAEITRTALAGLSNQHRAVLTLRFYEGLPHAQIAQLIDCSELAARSALCRAKCALAHKLKHILGTRVAQ